MRAGLVRFHPASGSSCLVCMVAGNCSSCEPQKCTGGCALAYETVLYEVADRLCTITLNRPEKLNAWTRQMHLDLRDAMQKAGADENVRAIILTGAGRGFCAGADMGGLQA